MRAVEKRISKLESNLRSLPCKKPGHDDLHIFFVTSEDGTLRAKDQALLDSIRSCARCKDKTIVMFMRFVAMPEKQVAAEPEPQPISFEFGKEPAKPEPRIRFENWQQPEDVPPVEQPTIRINLGALAREQPLWIDLLNDGDGDTIKDVNNWNRD